MARECEPEGKKIIYSWMHTHPGLYRSKIYLFPCLHLDIISDLSFKIFSQFRCVTMVIFSSWHNFQHSNLSQSTPTSLKMLHFTLGFLLLFLFNTHIWLVRFHALSKLNWLIVLILFLWDWVVYIEGCLGNSVYGP